MNNIIIMNAHTNNLKNINAEIEFGKFIICAGPSGSGKSSFAIDTLINKRDCIIKNYPKNVKMVSQRISSTNQKLEDIEKLSNLENYLIVIDEPLAGTTSEEAAFYSKLMKEISKNNYLIVVEHRREIIEFADYVLVFGPESGSNGGELIKRVSGKEYLSELPLTKIERTENKSNKKISALFSKFNNIDNYKVEICLNKITSISGSAGCGKSTYLDALFKAFDKSVGASERRKDLIEIKGKNYIRRPHIIDASPVSKNSKSTVATYYGVSKFFKDKDLNITVDDAIELYKDDNLIIRRLNHLHDIGLGYLNLNQSSYSLSGGECQRIKLAKLLCKKLGDRSIYIFDNPVRGLGENNIKQVMLMFDKLVKNNNTVLIAENDPTALKYVDEIINL